MNHPSLFACPLLLLPYTLTTVNDRHYVTDSQGVIAFYELGLNGYKRKDLKLGDVWRKQLLTIS